MSTTYIITGSNRGLGLGYVKALIQRPNVTIYAGVRTLSSAGELSDLAKAHKNLHIVQLASASTEDVKALAKKLDGKVEGDLVVIANAGIAKVWQTAETADLASIREHFEVNTLGPIVLFQGLASLLQSTPNAKFVAISTLAGSIGQMGEFAVPSLAYGTSKAALNYALAKTAQENPKLIVVPLHPGWVQTDMGNGAAESFGLERAPLSLEESVEGAIKVIDEATIEQSGKFIDYQGKPVAW